MEEETWLAEPALFHCGWQELVDAADASGRWAARQLAARCSAAELGQLGHTWVHVEPLASPAASWLYRTGHGTVADSPDGVRIPINVTAADLYPAAEAADKAESLLVARAYATAYCSVLAEEAGVTATPVIERDRNTVVSDVVMPSSLPGAAVPPTGVAET